MTIVSSFQKNWRVWLLAYAPLFIWIGVIFFMSSDQGSVPATSRFIRPLLEFLFPASPDETLQFYHFLIRKFAHLAAYAILGVLAAHAFGRGKHWPWISLAIVFVVACLDEFNQSFEPSRTGSVWDILLDITGGFTMIVVFWILGKLRSDFLGGSLSTKSRL